MVPQLSWLCCHHTCIVTNQMAPKSSRPFCDNTCFRPNQMVPRSSWPFYSHVSIRPKAITSKSSYFCCSWAYALVWTQLHQNCHSQVAATLTLSWTRSCQSLTGITDHVCFIVNLVVSWSCPGHTESTPIFDWNIWHQSYPSCTYFCLSLIVPIDHSFFESKQMWYVSCFAVL